MGGERLSRARRRGQQHPLLGRRPGVQCLLLHRVRRELEPIEILENDFIAGDHAPILADHPPRRRSGRQKESEIMIPAATSAVDGLL